MSKQIIEYKDEAEWHKLRAEVITSTDLAALYGMSPYLGAFELWHRKKDGVIPDFTPNDRTRWGNRLEKSIAEGVAEDNNWTVQPKKHFIMDEDLRAGSSFDYEIKNPFSAILEIKNVDNLVALNQWDIDGDVVQMPNHIELQIQMQLLVSGMAKAFAAALIGGNRIILVERNADEEIHQDIKEKIKEFWQSIKEGRAPEPDFSRDSEFIKKIYKNAKAGSVIESSRDDRIHILAEAYRVYGEQEKAAKDNKEATKAELLTLVGDAEKVLGEGFSISAGIVKGGPVSYIREDYRNFKINFKKTKEKKT